MKGDTNLLPKLYSAIHPVIRKVLKMRIRGVPPRRRATTVATYCQSMPTQLAQKNITKHGEQVDEKLCRRINVIKTAQPFLPTKSNYTKPKPTIPPRDFGVSHNLP